MKHSWTHNIILVIILFIATAGGCDKNDPPPVDETVTDFDGNVYHTVRIGTQVWMVENLKVTHYNDGTAIPLVTENLAWYFLQTDAYCWYENSEATNKELYGALYNWYAVSTGKLAPTGWHVPTDDEWLTLATFLGGAVEAGKKLKEQGTAHWPAPNEGTNSTGFTALPGGWRDFRSSGFEGLFDRKGSSGFWWTATTTGSDAFARQMNETSTYGLLVIADPKYAGFSVRCVKN